MDRLELLAYELVEGRGERKPLHRTIDGETLDVRSTAAKIGGTEKRVRNLVERRQIPFRRLGGRVIFLRHEIDEWLHCLPGCSVTEAQANREAKR
jgi:predicted DNA-binding transcriptional regulator AlpA